MMTGLRCKRTSGCIDNELLEVDGKNGTSQTPISVTQLLDSRIYCCVPTP